MRPPIASPQDQRPIVPLTGRLEWSAEHECVRLLFISPYWSRVRCELLTIRHNHYFKIGLPLFPLTLIVLWFTQLAKSEKQPDEFRLFSWGFLEIYGGKTTQVDWKSVKRVVESKGDVVILRRPFYKACYFITREDFRDEAESHKFASVVESLSRSQGATWPEIKSQFGVE